MARNDALELLHTAVNHYAPDGLVQAAIVQVRREMEAVGENHRVIALQLAHILVDGLAHGNWPGADFPGNWPPEPRK